MKKHKEKQLYIFYQKRKCTGKSYFQVKKILFYTLLLILILSCSESFEHDENSSTAIETAIPLVSPQKINQKKVLISSGDAQLVASIFLKKGNTSATRNVNQSQVSTFYDEETGNPLIYIVNFSNNNGFVIVSASKKYYPVLAFSTTGTINPNTESAAQLYLKEYKEAVKEAVLVDGDSLRTKYALQWAMFEQTSPTLTRSLPNELLPQIQAEINRKQAMGYTHLGNISAAASFLPANDYQALLNEMRDVTDPRYDYMEVNQFFIKSYDYETVGPILQTNWGQGSPFNVDAVNGYAGCVPIAVAQIAYYHKYPNRYNWDNIPSNPTSIDNTDFTYFIKDIRNLCQVTYGIEGTSSNIEFARDAFSALGYNASIVNYTNSTIRSSIISGNPIYLHGVNSYNIGHAWVCDGYMDKKHEASISFIPSANDPRFEFEYNPGSIFADYNTHAYSPAWVLNGQYGEFFHMNLGWFGNSNGWFREIFYFPWDTNNSYIFDRKALRASPNN